MYNFSLCLFTCKNIKNCEYGQICKVTPQTKCCVANDKAQFWLLYSHSYLRLKFYTCCYHPQSSAMKQVVWWCLSYTNNKFQILNDLPTTSCILLSPQLITYGKYNTVFHSVKNCRLIHIFQAYNSRKQCKQMKQKHTTAIQLLICSFHRRILQWNYTVAPRRNNWIK